jgi:hypothetical protein
MTVGELKTALPVSVDMNPQSEKTQGEKTKIEKTKSKKPQNAPFLLAG